MHYVSCTPHPLCTAATVHYSSCTLCPRNTPPARRISHTIPQCLGRGVHRALPLYRVLLTVGHRAEGCVCANKAFYCTNKSRHFLMRLYTFLTHSQVRFLRNGTGERAFGNLMYFVLNGSRFHFVSQLWERTGVVPSIT